MKNTKQMPYWEVEALIEERIAKESEEWDLDSYDIDQIRLEVYKENGWSYDPKPYDEEEEEEDYSEDCIFRNGIRDYYAELGMSRWDFY